MPRSAAAEESLSQTQLAEKLGMSQQQLARLESGESNPTMRTIARVAEGLGRQFVMTLQPAPDRQTFMRASGTIRKRHRR